MASSQTVVVDPAHLDGGDGTVEMALQLFSSRNEPMTYNQWQSLYFQLRNIGYPILEGVEPSDSNALQSRMKELYQEVQEEIHGPDFRALAVMKKAKATPKPTFADEGHRVPSSQAVADSVGQGEGRGASGSLPDRSSALAGIAQGQAVEQHDIATPRGQGISSGAGAGSPDMLLHDERVQQILLENEAVRTEATEENDQRMAALAQQLSEKIESGDKDGLAFLFRVEQMVKEYRDYYCTWQQMDTENLKVPIRLYAMEKLTELDGDKFEEILELKRHVYALGRLAGRQPEESRMLVKALWDSSERPSQRTSASPVPSTGVFHTPGAAATPAPAPTPGSATMDMANVLTLSLIHI